MKKVKRFSSFEELKAYKSTLVPDGLSLKRHEAMEKVFKKIRALIVEQKKNSKGPKHSGSEGTPPEEGIE